MRTDTVRKVAYIGFCVFTSISVVVLFGWDQRNGEIAECWKFSEALISIKTCAKWGGYQYAIRKETSLGPHNMTRYLVPPRKYSPYTVCTISVATRKCAPHTWPLGCRLWELRGRAPQKTCWLCVDRLLAFSWPTVGGFRNLPLVFTKLLASRRARKSHLTKLKQKIDDATKGNHRYYWDCSTRFLRRSALTEEANPLRNLVAK